MAINYINTGSSPNKGDGDSLRTAFNKINNNFRYLSTLTSTTTVSINDLLDDGTMTVPGHIIPSSNLTFDLGSTSSQWRSLYVGTSTIYLGGTPLTVSANGELIVDGNQVTTGSVQPYLEVTNTPIIVQAAILGEPITVTAEPAGSSAQVEIVIGEGPTIDSITITSAGSGYSEGQVYRVWSYYIGGPNDSSSIEFTIDTVDENGGILTITDAAFVGLASNVPGTYTGAQLDYRPSVFDHVDTGVTLTRGLQQALFNSDLELEYDNNTYISPLGTEWNNDGWGDLTDVRLRSYGPFGSALNNQVGNNIIGAELVMHDTANDKYYKFEFTQWGQDNGAYSYIRTEITDPNFFRKFDNGNEVDIIIPDDGDGAGVGITRAGNQGIYNPYREEGWNDVVSPSGTQWNTVGWEDLSDVETRTYTNFYEAYGNGGLGNRIPGSRAIMYVPDNEKYYAVRWLSWTQGGNGGGFSYLRYEIDTTKLDEGIRFADGSILKSAQGVGRVKSTASGFRRIEEVSGNKTVAVTPVVTTNHIGTTYQNNTAWELRVARTTEIDAVLDPYWNDQVTGERFYVSFDDLTYRLAYISSKQSDHWIFYYDVAPTPTVQTEGAPFYIRIETGGTPQVWWDKNDLPSGSGNFRGAVIDYHAFTGDATFIGTIHIVDDDGEENITHTEVSSGGSDSENDDLWLVQNEGTISYRRIDGESATLKIHWTAKVFYGSEIYD